MDFINKWLRLSRLLPLATVFTAISVSLAAAVDSEDNGLLGWAVVILGLLAVDALVERMGLLEKIEASLASTQLSHSGLRDRTQLSDKDFQTARTIDVIGISARGIIEHSNLYDLKQAVKSGARVRLILLNPSNEALTMWERLRPQSDRGKTARDVYKTLDECYKVIQDDSNKGSLEVGLIDFYPPFSMVGINMYEPHGSITIEIYGFGTWNAGRERPHIMIKYDNAWYDKYRHQFEEIKDSIQATTKDEIRQILDSY